MKIETSEIRSLETIEKPDGKYIRIGYVKRPSPAKRMREGTKRVAGNLWKRPAVKTVIIAHRDYSREGNAIEVLVYDDRMEFRSPGGLLSGVSLDDLKNLTRVHETRNVFVA